jgi:S1-C subfamily serine protease
MFFPSTRTNLTFWWLSAYAIGNPFGLDHTLTVGVVSGIGREVKSPIGRPITNVIQTGKKSFELQHSLLLYQHGTHPLLHTTSDASINPGNSGGPLLNGAGNLIGMNTSIYSPSGARWVAFPFFDSIGTYYIVFYRSRLTSIAIVHSFD